MGSAEGPRQRWVVCGRSASGQAVRGHSSDASCTHTTHVLYSQISNGIGLTTHRLVFHLPLYALRAGRRPEGALAGH